MSMSSRKISRMSDSLDGRDRISNLPEYILRHILSRVPTMYAVRTSVLSKKWRDKWTSIYNIDINDRELFIRNRRNELSFLVFVVKMLHKENILGLCLSFWRKYRLSRIKYWIYLAMKLKVESFKLFYAHEGMVLLLSIFNILSLKKLELKLPCTIKVPANICFPYLTNLYLDGVEVLNENPTTGVLTLEFPALKKLKLRLCTWLNVNRVEIYAPAMTTFKSETSDDAEVNRCKIKIVGARLVKFESSGGLGENCSLVESTVTYASLLKYYKPDDERLFQNFGSQIRKLLKGFSCIKYLIISGYLAQAIGLSKPRPHIPMYDKLEQLVLHSPGNAKALLELLHAAPSLKLLVVDRDVWDAYSYDYEAMESVPSCLTRHLEEVRFNYYSWTYKFYLEKFLLENGKGLKKVYISGYNSMPKDEIIERLSAFAAGSTCLTIVAI